MSNYRTQLVDLIKRVGCVEREDEVTLSGGDQTNIYLDIPHILSTGATLRLAALVIAEWVALHVTEDITAVGSPQTGADALTAVLASRLPHPMRWFTVRKAFKEHGPGGFIQGAMLSENDTVVLIDDVASTGASLLRAANLVEDTGARVAAVIPLVDRAGVAAGHFDARGIPYWPVITYLDLDIPALIQSAEGVL